MPARLFAFYDTFEYTHILSGPDGWQGLFFRGKYDGEDFEGVDLVQLDADGLICELRISMRPIQVVKKMAVGANTLAQEILKL